jgi:hypothetical protein
MVDEGPYSVNQVIVNPRSGPVDDILNSTYNKSQVCFSKKLRSQESSTSVPNCTKKALSIFHQNVRGLRDKNNELLGSLLPELPHILCLTEHFNRTRVCKFIYRSLYSWCKVL